MTGYTEDDMDVQEEERERWARHAPAPRVGLGLGLRAEAIHVLPVSRERDVRVSYDPDKLLMTVKVRAALPRWRFWLRSRRRMEYTGRVYNRLRVLIPDMVALQVAWDD